MKKYYLLIIIFMSLLLFSCKDKSIKINLEYKNNQYELVTNDSQINLKDYITYSKEYKIIYLDQEYSSSNNSIFSLNDGLNTFLIKVDSKEYVISVFKEYYCSVTIINESLEKLDDLSFKYNTSLSTDLIEIDKYIENGYTFNNLVEISYDLETFETMLINELVIKKDIYIRFICDANEYEIKLILDNQEKSIKLKTGDKILLETPDKEGYTFLGWFADEVLLTNDSLYNPSLGDVFEARFSKNIYTLTYKYLNEETVISYEYNQDINEFIPPLEGYDFLGWYLDDVLFTNNTYEFDYDIVLKAKIEAKEFEINYKNIDLEYSQTVKYNDDFTLYVPKKDGYIFKYWEYNGEKFTSTKYNFLCDIELVAVWEEDINIVFETFGGIIDGDVSIDENNNIVLPKAFKEGYNFKYWCSDKTLDNKVTELNIDTYSGETLYAYYELDDANLKYSFISTKYNSHASTYNELAIFDSTKSGFTSLYWHKIAISKNGDSYYISGIAKSGENLSSLGEYDYVILAYSAYPYYKQFVNMDCYIGYRVETLVPLSSMTTNNSVNIISFIGPDPFEEIENAKNYLEELYGAYKSIDQNITLINKYNNHSITWKTSNREIISSTGEYKKPYMTRDVTLSAYIADEIIYEFTVNVKGETDKSKALSTGYIYTPYNTITQNAMDMLDIIYIAFLDIDAEANFTNLTRVTNNINTYIRDKANKAGTKIVVSVNQSSSSAFPTVAQSEALRQKLASNIVSVIVDLELDGVDIDWETPTSDQAHTFTLLMKEIYTQVKAVNSDYLVTAAIGGGKWQPPKYDLPNSINYLDYVNLMTYSAASDNGYYQNSLYPSTKSRTLVSCTISESIEIHNNLGVENHKILLGIPFYLIVQTECNGPGTKTGTGKSKWYHLMFTDYALSDTMIEYFDEECGVPYRYDATTKTFISFDNEESIRVKCEYINTLGLAGIMYWQYGQDVDDMLTNAIAKYINS